MPRLALLTVVFLSFVSAACEYGDDGPPRPTNTFPATAPSSTSTPSTSGVREFGEDPVFWRTLDDFKTLTANEPYFVVIRVNDYTEPTLRVRAEKQDGSGDIVTFDVVGAEPTGDEPESAFFPTSIELPSPGEWTLVVGAGDEEVMLDVTVQPGAAP